MNKQTTAFVAIILITCLLGFGVESMFNMTALERIEKTMNAQVQLQSYRMDAKGSMKMGLEPEENVPSYLNQTFKLYDNMTLEAQADIVSKPDEYQMKMLESIKMNGMEMDIELYLKNGELLVKYPILGDYLLITLDDVKDVAGIELPEDFNNKVMALLPKVQEDLVAISKKYITENNVKYVEPYHMKTNGYEQTLNVVQIEMDAELIIQVYADLILALLENEQGLALVKEVSELNSQELPTDFEERLEEIKTIVIEAKDPQSQARAELTDAIGPVLENFKYTYKVGFSNLNIPKMMWMDMEMAIPMDDFDDLTMRMSYNLEYKLSKFNEIDEILLPELEESDVIRIGELIERFGGF